MKIKKRIKKDCLILFLIILAFLFLQSQIAIRNKIPDHDEAVYYDLAKNILKTGIAKRGDVQQTILVENSPLPFCLIALGMLISPSLVSVRLVGTIFSVLTIILTYIFGKKISSSFAGLAAVVLLAFHPLFLAYSHSIYLEPFLTFFLLSGVYFLASGLKTKRDKDFLWSGLFLALAALTKFLVLGLVLGIVIYFFWTKNKRRISFKHLLILLFLVFGGLLLWPFYGLIAMPKEFSSQFLYYFTREFLGKNNPDPRVGVSLPKYFWAIILSLTPLFCLASFKALLDKISHCQRLLVCLIVGWFALLLTTGVKEMRFWYPILPILTINIGSFIANLPKKLRIIILILIIINYFLIFRAINIYYWRLNII